MSAATSSWQEATRTFVAGFEDDIRHLFTRDDKGRLRTDGDTLRAIESWFNARHLFVAMVLDVPIDAVRFAYETDSVVDALTLSYIYTLSSAAARVALRM